MEGGQRGVACKQGEGQAEGAVHGQSVDERGEGRTTSRHAHKRGGMWGGVGEWGGEVLPGGGDCQRTGKHTVTASPLPATGPGEEKKGRKKEKLI
jgi:hypothetical protein